MSTRMKSFRLGDDYIDALSRLSKVYGNETRAVEEALRRLGTTVMNYLTEQSGGFNKGSITNLTPVKVDVKKALSRSATDGYVYSGTGTVKIRFNGGEEITLDAGESVEIASERVFFKVDKIQVVTTSVDEVTFKLLLI